jgi:tripartite-type tricarboxylate transporter receptor subunit TctC
MDAIAGRFSKWSFVFVAFFAASAWSQSYPSKPIRMVVPFPPGATTDIVARLLGEKLRTKWGQAVLVEARAGAGGNIGAELVYKASPDGYTLLVSPPPPLVINKALYSSIAYEPDAFTPVTIIGAVPTVLIVNSKVSASSVNELIAFAKANPDRLNYASQGAGSTAHLTAEMFKSMAGVKVMHVPYKGAAPALQGLVAGQVDVMFANLSSALPYIRNGQVRALSVNSDKRNGLLPDVPSTSEVLAGFLSVGWFGVVAPPKTSPEIANRLSTSIAEILKLPDIAQRLGQMTVEPTGSTPEEMAVFMKQESERWGSVVRSSALRSD